MAIREDREAIVGRRLSGRLVPLRRWMRRPRGACDSSFARLDFVQEQNVAWLAQVAGASEGGEGRCVCVHVACSLLRVGGSCWCCALSRKKESRIYKRTRCPLLAICISEKNVDVTYDLRMELDVTGGCHVMQGGSPGGASHAP